ncbi:MAG: hypothetical protein MZU84_02310 [Sphingobacterium sp.]|nr:hypothetical protein [Sphingobacterium sp.]
MENSGYINAIGVHGNDLLVGGYFYDIQGVWAWRIAKWNGSQWSNLGSGVSAEWINPSNPQDYVNAIVVIGNDVYVGGKFSYSGYDRNSSHIACWHESGQLAVSQNAWVAPHLARRQSDHQCQQFEFQLTHHLFRYR